MATWIQGTQQYVPQAQLYQPDFNYMQNVATQKQTKYELARKQLSNVYGSLLNSELTRDDNIQTRDQFFKDIDTDIKKMASMDLSKAANVEASSEIFSQLLDDKAIAHDMTWTKNFNDQVSRSNSLKLDGKRENGDMYWEGGDRLLQYAREEYKNASADDAMKMGSVEYIPAKDIYSMAMKIAKDNDMDVTIEQSNGRYIYKMKNGQVAYNSFGQIFGGVLGNDPGVQRYYAAKAQLGMKDFAYSMKDQYGSVQAAEQAYCDQVGAQIEEQYRQLLGQTDKASKDGKKKVDYAKSKIDSVADTPSEKTEMSRMIEEWDAQNQQIDATGKYIKSAEGALVSKGKYNPNSIISMMSTMGLMTDLQSVTQAVADMNMSVEMDEDQYGLEAVRHANELEMAQVNYQYDVMLETLKGNIKANKGSKTSSPDPNQPLVFSDYEGAITNDNTENGQFAAYNERGKEIKDMSDELCGNQMAYVRTYADALTNEIANGTAGPDAMGAYVGMVSAGMNDKGNFSFGGDENTEYKAARESFNKELAACGDDMQKKYNVCKKYYSSMQDNAGSWHAMTDYAIKNFDANDKNNRLGSSESFNAIWNSTSMQGLRHEMSAQSAVLTQYKKALANDKSNLLQGIYADERLGDERERANLQDCINAYLKDDGNFATKDEYVEALKKSDWCRRNNCDEETLVKFANYSYGGYEDDDFWFWRSDKEANLDQFIDDDPWEVNEGRFYDKDKLFGVKDAFKTLWGQHSKINGDLEGQGMGYNRALGFMVSGHKDNNLDYYQEDVQDFCLEALQRQGFSSVYWGGLSAKPEDEMSENDKDLLLTQLLRDIRDTEKGDVFACRYVNAAMGSSDKVGLEITVPINWLKEQNASKTLEGNASNKFTIYMDKSEYTGSLKELGQNNALDYLMKVNNSVPLDTDNSCYRNMSIKKYNEGQYYISGSVMNYDENNNEVYRPFNSFALKGMYYSSPAQAFQDWQIISPYIRTAIKS